MQKVHFAATGHDLYLDLPLTNVVINHRPRGMIADLIAPVVEVPRLSGNIIEFSQADALRVEDDKRAPGTLAKRVTRNVSSHYFFCTNHALADGVTIEDRANADPVYATRMFGSRATYLMDKLALNWERRIALEVTSTSNVGSSAAVASVWTGAGADPLSDLNTAIDNVTYATGYRPNRIVMGLKPWNALRRHSTVRNLLFAPNAQQSTGYANVEQIQTLLDIERVLVGGAFINTAEENIAQSLSTIWGTSVLVYYANPNPTSREEPSFMYTHRCTAPGLPNMQVERHPYNSRTKTDDIEVGYYQDENRVGTTLAFLLTGATA